MRKVSALSEGLRSLLRGADTPSYSLVEQNGLRFLDLGEKRVPLMYWRYDQRFLSMKRVIGAKLGELCSVKTFSFARRSTGLNALLLRELDLAAWWLDSPAVSVGRVLNGGACNLVGETAAGTVFTLELGATLEENMPEQGKRVVHTTNGMTCDRAVDTQVEQFSVYLYAGGELTCFSDADFTLYGLDRRQVAECYCARALLTGEADPDEYIGAYALAGKWTDAILDTSDGIITKADIRI